ncbi:hypothetical protein C8R11_102289 [Nitrosomonas aestuarii]|nr:hypothetical protein C8R11_102289 [Nitrosomonas aestuarii]
MILNFEIEQTILLLHQLSDDDYSVHRILRHKKGATRTQQLIDPYQVSTSSVLIKGFK